MINRECDVCKKTDEMVYERYSVQIGDSFQGKYCGVTGQIIPSNLTYWCSDCAKKHRENNDA